MWGGSTWAPAQVGVPGRVCDLRPWSPRKRKSLEAGMTDEWVTPTTHTTLTSLWSSPVLPAWAPLHLGCLGLLGPGSSPHTLPFCTPSCSRHRQSSGRWMRPLPCSRRCCDPNSNSQNPQWSTNRDGSNKIFCQKLFLSVSVCGGTGGVQGCGVSVCSRRAAGWQPGPSPGGQRDAPVWVCLWHSARPESCCLAAPFLPSSPRSSSSALHCAVATEARPGPTLASTAPCGPGLA